MMKNLIPRLLLSLMLFTPWAVVHADVPTWSLDAIIDTRANHSEGIRVLAVTPGGAAEALGVVAGDRLLSINGLSLATALQPQRTLDHALETAGGQASIVLLRDGERLTFSGALARWMPVSANDCGYVSDIDSTPNVSENIHRAQITQIDGKSTPLFDNNRHRLEAGQHVLVVSEFIPGHLFTRGQTRELRLMKRRKLAGAYKALVVDVEPNMRYSIGARLIPSQLSNDNIRDNAYWEPVVHKSRVENCR